MAVSFRIWCLTTCLLVAQLVSANPTSHRSSSGSPQPASVVQVPPPPAPLVPGTPKIGGTTSSVSFGHDGPKVSSQNIGGPNPTSNAAATDAATAAAEEAVSETVAANAAAAAATTAAANAVNAANAANAAANAANAVNAANAAANAVNAANAATAANAANSVAAGNGPNGVSGLFNGPLWGPSALSPFLPRAAFGPPGAFPAVVPFRPAPHGFSHGPHSTHGSHGPHGTLARISTPPHHPAPYYGL